MDGTKSLFATNVDESAESVYNGKSKHIEALVITLTDPVSILERASKESVTPFT
jgi:hypothetical protein